MTLTAVDVKDNSEEYHDFVSLYHTAFPPEELIPEEGFYDSIHMEGASVTAYYDEENPGKKVFIGFTYVIETEQFLFLYFFAVNPKHRSRGFGTEIIRSHLMKKYPGKTIVVNVEYPDESAEDYTLRLERIKFYKRLGFVQLNCSLYDGRVLFLVLSTSSELNLDEYNAFLQRGYDIQNLKDTVQILRPSDT